MAKLHFDLNNELLISVQWISCDDKKLTQAALKNFLKNTMVDCWFLDIKWDSWGVVCSNSCLNSGIMMVEPTTNSKIIKISANGSFSIPIKASLAADMKKIGKKEKMIIRSARYIDDNHKGYGNLVSELNDNSTNDFIIKDWTIK